MTAAFGGGWTGTGTCGSGFAFAQITCDSVTNLWFLNQLTYNDGLMLPTWQAAGELQSTPSTCTPLNVPFPPEPLLNAPFTPCHASGLVMTP